MPARCSASSSKGRQRGRTRHTTEIYSVASRPCLRHLDGLALLARQINAQGEHCSTDIAAMAAADGVPGGHRISDAQVVGVNSPCNWQNWSAPIQRQALRLMEQGVRLARSCARFRPA